jgi:(1->4)-alpha-D-glucan 1-alpha-D-glucosylmutase
MRARHPMLFAAGEYHPLRVEGPLAEHILAFARTHREVAAIVAVPRLCAGLIPCEDPFTAVPVPIMSPRSVNDPGTAIILPRSLAGRRCSDALGGTTTLIESGWGTGRLAAADLFATLPAALLEVS